MAGTKPKVDRELLGRVAALTPGQQRWLRTVLQSVFTMETPGKRRAEEEPEERPRAAQPQPAGPGGAGVPRRRGRGEGEAINRESAATRAVVCERISVFDLTQLLSVVVSAHWACVDDFGHSILAGAA